MVLHILPSNLVESPLFFYFLMHVIISFSFHMKGFPCPSLFAISLSWKYFFFHQHLQISTVKGNFIFMCYLCFVSWFPRGMFSSKTTFLCLKSLGKTTMVARVVSFLYSELWLLLSGLIWPLCPLSTGLTQVSLSFSQWGNPVYHESSRDLEKVPHKTATVKIL